MNHLKRWGLCLSLATALSLPARADEPSLRTWQDAQGDWHIELVVPPESLQQAETFLTNLLAPVLAEESDYDQGDYEQYQQGRQTVDYPLYQQARDPSGYYPGQPGVPYEEQGDMTSPNGAFPDKHDTWGGPPDKAPQADR